MIEEVYRTEFNLRYTFLVSLYCFVTKTFYGITIVICEQQQTRVDNLLVKKGQFDKNNFEKSK